MESKAIVARGPFSQRKWTIEQVKLREPRDEEAIVEVVASGICHTDLHCGDTGADEGVPAVYYPRVLGHEGAGYVVKVGKAVTKVKPGDAVFMSFAACGACHVCRSGPPSHCINAFNLNFMGEPVFASSSGSASNPDIGGRFFGQSSFARHTIASASSLVNASALHLTRSDLALLAPLGCGLQTGSGTVLNVAQAGPDDAIAIVGLGGVGLAAVMAASRIAKCKTIIGIDRVAGRLELARELGATHVFDTTDSAFGELVKRVKEVTEDGAGVSVAIDTSAHPGLVAAQIAYTRYMGKIIQVGTGMPESFLEVHMQSFMVSGKQYFGAIQGWSRKEEYIPQLVRWWREGKFPVERLVKMFAFEEFEDALGSMGQGIVVKPVMVWEDE
ncbi:zinc-binding dehydrogenase [Coniella lustricola]|uniref:Zinc-binding dehydrogenase n=1 Tax=Coniella lustricola TaxID=2025994 RepID=A0A2T3A757_9PEZI|nr:zinc-binding dehydrogenase [Coniella lustricola]